MSNPTPNDASLPPLVPAERRFVLGLIVVTLLLSGLPYALGYFVTPPGMRFVGAAYNIDDYCNYLSWLRQTMDGRFFFHNQFTTEPQRNLECNVFFWLLGQIARIFHLSPQAALQVARVGGGVAVLGIAYRFLRAAFPDNLPARLTGFGFVCLSGGLGWLSWVRWHDKNGPGGPVDAWQPEAFTFLTLYTNALMTVSTALIVAALYALLRGEQTGRLKYALWAGLCGAVLGNMHSYDVLHLAAAWGLFLIVWTALRRGRGVGGSWGRGLLAFALTLPTTLYQYFVFQRETVFHARANTPTLSPSFKYYVLGYGLVFVLALFAALRQKSPRAETTQKMSLLGQVVTVCWAAGGLAVIYLPVAFQRKMIMGTHIPLCGLAGVGAVMLASRCAPRIQNALLVLMVAFTLPSSLLFLVRDMTHLTENRSETQQQPFLLDRLLQCYAWLRRNTALGSAIVGYPPDCAALPGYAGRAVWAGHWAETPHYGTKLSEFLRFADQNTGDDARHTFLAQTHAQYLLYPNDVSQMTFTTKSGRLVQFADLAHHPLSGTVAVYANQDYTLFRLPAP